MTNKYERPDPSAPPENKYAPEYPVCLECGEEIEYAEVDKIVDCVDHLPIDVLPDVCEVPGTEWVSRADYDRCKRALDRAVKEVGRFKRFLKFPPDDESKEKTFPGYTKNRENSPKRVILREPERCAQCNKVFWGLYSIRTCDEHKNLEGV